jgi:hypothetical protein
MKLHAVPNALTFSASPQAQRLSGTSKVDRDSVRFGSTVQLAKITAADIAAIKANPTEAIAITVHEWGHALLRFLKGDSLEKIVIRDPLKPLEEAAVVLKTSARNSNIEKEIASRGMVKASGAILKNKVFNPTLFEKLVNKQISILEFFVQGNGEVSLMTRILSPFRKRVSDYDNLKKYEHLLNSRASLSGDSMSTKLTKFFKRTFSDIRAFFNPHKEHALMVQWIKDTHELMKNIPEEGLFRLAKTLEKEGTIEGHETIERLVKEALGNHYDTLQKQFNTLIES